MITFYDLRITFPSIEEAYRGGSIQPLHQISGSLRALNLQLRPVI